MFYIFIYKEMRKFRFLFLYICMSKEIYRGNFDDNYIKKLTKEQFCKNYNSSFRLDRDTIFKSFKELSEKLRYKNLKGPEKKTLKKQRDELLNLCLKISEQEVMSDGYKFQKKPCKKDNSEFRAVSWCSENGNKIRVPKACRKTAWKRFYKLFPGLKGKEILFKPPTFNWSRTGNIRLKPILQKSKIYNKNMLEKNIGKIVELSTTDGETYLKNNSSSYNLDYAFSKASYSKKSDFITLELVFNKTRRDYYDSDRSCRSLEEYMRTNKINNVEWVSDDKVEIPLSEISNIKFL